MSFSKSIIYLIIFLFSISGSLPLAEDYSDSDITKDLVEIGNEAKPKLLILYHVQNYTSPVRPEVPVEEI